MLAILSRHAGDIEPLSTFAFNNVVDSIFYGLGKTNYMLFQSLVINIMFYGTAFILFQTEVFTPNLTLIALLFAGGTAFDSILTMAMYAWMLRKKKINPFIEDVI